MSEHGDLIRRARQKQGLTLDEVGARVNHKGSYIGRIENGRLRGSLNALIAISEALELDPELVIRKAGFDNIHFSPAKPLELDIDTLEFIELKSEIKKLLLKLAPILQSYLDHNI